MDVLECIHNLLSAGILSLFCLLCYLIHKCCCNVTAAGDTKKTCFCGIHEITGQITPSNNIIAIGPDDVPFKQPLYKFLSKGTELNLPEPSPSCDNCCQTPCFSDIETSSSSTSGSLLDDYIYSDALPEADTAHTDTKRNNEYMTNMVMLEQSNKYPRSRTKSYSYLEEPINKRSSEATRRSSAPYDVEHRSSRRRSSTQFTEPRKPPKLEPRSSLKRSSTPYMEHPPSTKSKRSSRSQYSENLSSSKRSSSRDDSVNIFTHKYSPTSINDMDTYAVQEVSNKSSFSTKPRKSISSTRSKRSKKSKRRPSRSTTSAGTKKEYRRYDRDERDVEPEQEEHCVRVKVCVKGANSVANNFNDKHFKETASGTKICIVGPSFVKQNLPGEERMGRSGATGPAETTESKGRCSNNCAFKTEGMIPTNYGKVSPAFAVPQQAYCAPKVVVHMGSCCQQGQNYSGQAGKCPNIFGQLTRSTCKCLPNNNNIMGNVKRKLSRLCCNCGCHKIKSNGSGSAYDGQLDDTEVVYNSSTGEYKIKQNPDSRPNENLSTAQQTSTQEKSSNKSAGINNGEVIDEIKIKRIDCCCGETCPLKVAAAKKYRNVYGKHPPVAGGVQWLQASNSRPNSQGTANSYPEIDSGRGSSQRGTNDDCLTRLTDSSITRLYQKYGCDTTCSRSSSNQDVYADPLIRLTRKYGTPSSKQNDSGHGTNHPSYCECASCTENPIACFIPSENVHAFSPCKKSAMSWFDQECTCDDEEEENLPPAKKFASEPDKLGNHRKWHGFADLLNLECTCHEDDILVYHTEIENEAFLEAGRTDSDEQLDRPDSDKESYKLNESEDISVYEDCEPCPNLNNELPGSRGQGEKGHGRQGDSSAEKGQGQKKSSKGWFNLDCTCEEDEEEEREKNISISSKFVSASDNLGDHATCPIEKQPCGRIKNDPCDKTCPNYKNQGDKDKVVKGKSGSPTGDTMWSLLADYFNLECHCEDDDNIFIFGGTKSDKKALLSTLKQGQQGAGKRGGPAERGEINDECDPECPASPSITSKRQRGSPEGSSGGKRRREGSPGGKEGRAESPAVSLGGMSGGKGSRTGSPGRSYGKDGPKTKDEEDDCNPKCPNVSGKKSSRQRKENIRGSSRSKREREGSPGEKEGRGESPAVSLGGRSGGKGSRTGSPGRSYENAETRDEPLTKDEEDDCNPKCPNASGKKSSRQREKGTRGSSRSKRGQEGSPGEKEEQGTNLGGKEGRGRNSSGSPRRQEGAAKRGATPIKEVDDKCDPKCSNFPSTKSPAQRVGREKRAQEGSLGSKEGRRGSPGEKEGRGKSPISSSREQEGTEKGGGPAGKAIDDESNPKSPNSFSIKSLERRRESPGGSPKEKGSRAESPIGKSMEGRPRVRSQRGEGSSNESPGGREERAGRTKWKGERTESHTGKRERVATPGEISGRGIPKDFGRIGGDDECDPECPDSLRKGSVSRSGGTRESGRRPERQGVQKEPGGIKNDECDPECPDSLKKGPVDRSEGTKGSRGRPERQGVPKRPGGVADEECDPEYPDSLKKGPVDRSEGTKGSRGRSERQGVPKGPGGVADEECDPECPDSLQKGPVVRSEGTKRSRGRPERQGVPKGPGGVADDECDPECPDSLKKGPVDRSEGTKGSRERPERQGVQKRPGGVADEECDPEYPDSLKKGPVYRSEGTKGSRGRPERQGVPKGPGGVADEECDPECPDSLKKGPVVRSEGTKRSRGRPERQGVPKGPGGVADEECDPECPDFTSTRSPKRFGETGGSTGRQGILREPVRTREDNECDPSCEYSSSLVSTEDEDCQPVCPSINSDLTDKESEVRSSTGKRSPASGSHRSSPTAGSKSPVKRSPASGSHRSSPTGGSTSPGKRSLSPPGSGSRRSSPTGSRPASRPRSPDNFIYGKERPDVESKTPSKDMSGRTTPEDGVFKYITPGKSSKSTVSSSQTRFTDLLLPDKGDNQATLSSGQCSTICSGISTKKSTPVTSTTVSKRGFNKDFDNEVPRKRAKGNYSTREDEDDSSRCSICCKYLKLTENKSSPNARERCIECCQAIRERINRNKFNQQKPLESSDRVWPSKSKSTNSFHQIESRRLVRVRARSTGPSTNLKTHSVSSKIQIMSNSKSSIDKSNLDNVGIKPLVRIRIKKYKQGEEQTDDTSLLKSIADCIEDVCICSKEIDEVKSHQNPKNVTDMLAELRKDPNVAWSETSDNTVTGTTTDSATMDKYHITLEETRQMCPLLSESGDIMNIPKSTSPEDPQYGKFFPYKPSPCKLPPCPMPDFPCSRPCPCGKHYCYPVPPNFDSFVRVYHQVPENFPGVCDDRQRTGVCCEKKSRYVKDKSGSCNPECYDPYNTPRER